MIFITVVHIFIPQDVTLLMNIHFPLTVSLVVFTLENNFYITNSYFSVPFDEDEKDKSVWFLDHDYLENMYGMFKKVNGMFL